MSCTAGTTAIFYYDKVTPLFVVLHLYVLYIHPIFFSQSDGTECGELAWLSFCKDNLEILLVFEDLILPGRAVHG